MSDHEHKTLVVDQHKVAMIFDGLRRIASIGASIGALTRVIEVADLLGNQEPCERCENLHAKLQGGYVLAGLNLALDVLGTEAAYQSERLENMLIEIEEAQHAPGSV